MTWTMARVFQLFFLVTYSSLTLVRLFCNAGPPRRSGRINKGKAPATADELLPSARGTKRPLAVEAAAPSDGDDDDLLTPRRASKSKGRADVRVVINSPPHPRPTRRQRLGMAGESADVSSENVEQIEHVEDPNEQWAGTGKVRFVCASN